jgi:hypothetical protein
LPSEERYDPDRGIEWRTAQVVALVAELPPKQALAVLWSAVQTFKAPATRPAASSQAKDRR